MSSAPIENSGFAGSQPANKSFSAISKPAANEVDKATDALCDRFTILKSISASEDEAIYLARDRSSEETVRLKVISGTAADNPARLKLFYLESHAASLLSHQNIVKTSEATCAGNSHFCAIEHRREAVTLRNLLDQTGWLDVDQAIDIAGQILSAIEHAHSRGVWHLRLRPEEILIEPDGRALMTGFGIQSSDEMVWAHKERTLLCPPRYISPEQTSDCNIDHRADLYSMGIVLFEMLTDRVPFDAPDSDSIRQKHISRAPEPPCIYREGIPEPLSELVIDMLEKSADERIRRVSSYGSLLRRLIDVKLSAAPAARDESIADTASHSATRDFLPFGLTYDQTVIDAELVDVSETSEEIISETGQSETVNPIYDSSVADTSPVPAELVLSSISRREPFEPPTISAMDVPFDQNYDCTPPLETPRREPTALRLLPQADSKDVESDLSAISVSRVMPLSIETVSRRAKLRRAFMVIAGIALIVWPLVLIQRSRSGRDQNAATPKPTESGTKDAAAETVASPPADQQSSPQGAGESNSTGQGTSAAATSPTPTRIRSSRSGRQVRRSQSRSKRSQPTRRWRRGRR